MSANLNSTAINSTNTGRLTTSGYQVQYYNECFLITFLRVIDWQAGRTASNLFRTAIYKIYSVTACMVTCQKTHPVSKRVSSGSTP